MIGAIIAVNFTVPPVYGQENIRACAHTTPVKTLKEMWPALFACWNGSSGNEDSEIGLVFSLRRDGTLIGKPKITARQIQGDETQQQAFETDVLDAIEKALPLPFSDSMGSAVAGRVLAVRVKGDGGWSVRY